MQIWQILNILNQNDKINMENQGDGNFLRAIEVVLGWIESLKLVPVGCMRGERIKVSLLF